MQLAAIRATMARSRELETEADYLAWVDLEARLRGANHLAYPPVIAAGQLEHTCYFWQAFLDVCQFCVFSYIRPNGSSQLDF